MPTLAVITEYLLDNCEDKKKWSKGDAPQTVEFYLGLLLLPYY